MNQAVTHEGGDGFWWAGVTMLAVLAFGFLVLLVVVTLTGPAPYTEILGHLLAALPGEAHQERLAMALDDKVLSMIEVSRLECDFYVEQGWDYPVFCRFAEVWPLPVSIRWPLNH